MSIFDDEGNLKPEYRPDNLRPDPEDMYEYDDDDLSAEEGEEEATEKALTPIQQQAQQLADQYKQSVLLRDEKGNVLAEAHPNLSQFELAIRWLTTAVDHVEEAMNAQSIARANVLVALHIMQDVPGLSAALTKAGVFDRLAKALAVVRVAESSLMPIFHEIGAYATYLDGQSRHESNDQ